MYAIVEVESKQYELRQGDEVEVDRLNLEKGQEITFDKVMLISDRKKISVGQPYVEGACVTCEVISHYKGDKVIAFKKRRRKSSCRKKGARAALTKLRVRTIQVAPN
jgi:large subunit ribosomal protein L21